MHPRAIVLALLAAASTVVGCAPPPRDPAVVAYEGLFDALVRGDAVRSWGLLGPRTRAALADDLGLGPDAALDAIGERFAVRPGWTFTVDQAHRARLAGEPVEGRDRVVIAALADQSWSIPVVAVDGNWRVELLDATLHEGPPGG